jgi:3-oxoacyl-[acyl-carrier-protein] synthase-1
VLKTGATKRIGPFAVPKCMSSTVSANLATAYRIKGMNFSITSACSTSLHCIGMAAQQIALGQQDIMFAGGGRGAGLDALLPLRRDGRDVVEVQRHARARLPRLRRRSRRVRHLGRRRDGGAGAAGPRRGARREDLRRGHGLRRHLRRGRHGGPLGRGRRAGHARRARTLPEGRKVSYINAHGTSTPVGDVGEIEAVRRVFGEGSTPPVSSTKSMTGHAQGAAGALEAIFCLLMLKDDFIAPSINVETLDPALKPEEIATSTVENAGLDTVMTNSFGFGGTNGSMLLSRYTG